MATTIRPRSAWTSRPWSRPPRRAAALALATQARQAATSIGPVNVQRVTREGRTLDVTVTVSALKDEAGVVYAAVSTERDISEKLRLETEVRFRAMADLIPTLLKIEDARGSAEFLNRAWTDFTGLSSTQPLLGDGWQSYVHPDDLKPFLLAICIRRAPRAPPVRGDVRLRGADGGYHWMRRARWRVATKRARARVREHQRGHR
jgi:two-component system, chemotaxis family, CheB/CheR fusion protein